MLPTKRKLIVAFLLFVISVVQSSFAQNISPRKQRACLNSTVSIQVLNVVYANATFVWQDSTALGWNTLVSNATYQGTTNDTLIIRNLPISLNGRKYRCIIDSAGMGVKRDTTSSSLLLVRSQLVKPQLSASQNICFNASRDTIRILQAAQGADTGFRYQWQYSNNGLVWVNLINPDSSFISIDTLSSNKFYRLKATSLAGCGSVISDSIFIRINPALQKPKLAVKTFFACYLSNPDSLRIINPSSNYSYQWQISSDSINFINLLNDTGVVKQSVQAITQKLYYRVRATQKFSCGTLFSDTTTVSPFSILRKPAIFGTQTICFDEDPDTLKIVTQTGVGSDVKFQWQSSINGTVWTDISGQTTKRLILTKNGITKFYRVKATWPRNCGIIFTDSVLVSVYTRLQAGVIGTNQNVCYGATPSLLSFQTLASGGGDSYTYQWQESVDSVLFTNIPSAVSIIYQVPMLTSTKFYRVRITSTQSCGVVNSNIIKIKVYPIFIGPTISSNDTICYNTRPDTLRLSIPATGGNGTFTYLWQKSTTGSLWQNITGQNSNKYRPNELLTTTLFRLVTFAGPNCGVDTSNTITIMVWPKLVKPRINSNQNICYNTNADTLRLVQFASGANNVFTYQWQISDEGLVWTNIAGQNASKYFPGKLTATKYYRIIAISSYGCSFISSDSLKINVYQNLQAGVLQGAQTICYDSIPSELTFATNPSGGGNAYSYQWQVSNDSITFTNIVGATSISYKPIKLNATKFYRVRITSAFGCGIVNTNIIKVKVYEKFFGAQIGNSGEICYGYVPVPLYMTQRPIGGSKTYGYQWQSSIDNINWVNIQNQTSDTLPMVQNLVTTYFRLINYSTQSCGIDTSNVVSIIALALPDTTMVLGPVSVCRNQQELFYSLEQRSSKYSYEWIVNKGEVLTNPFNYAVFITWNNEVGLDTILVKQTNKLSGCFNYMKLPIQLESQMAPSKTQIIRKSNTNILVCKDTASGINYQWGFVERATSTYTDLFHSNLRYVQLPHTFDSSLYLYFVKTWFSNCVTTTFMNGSDLSIGFDENTFNEIEIYPNPTTNFVHINNINFDNVKIECYNLIGEQISVNIIKADKKVIFDENIPPGIYILKVYINNEVYNAKVVLK
jgi:hypothetical protein